MAREPDDWQGRRTGLRSKDTSTRYAWFYFSFELVILPLSLLYEFWILRPDLCIELYTPFIFVLWILHPNVNLKSKFPKAWPVKNHQAPRLDQFPRHEVFGKAGLFGRRMLRKNCTLWLFVRSLKRAFAQPCLSKLWLPTLLSIQADMLPNQPWIRCAHYCLCSESGFLLSHSHKQAPTVSATRERGVRVCHFA